MQTPSINPYKPLIPMIYAYTTPQIAEHKGWTKIGYTDSQTVQERIAQQTHTADVKVELLWEDNAIYKDGSGQTFKDYDFHRYLTDKAHIERKPKTEWFHIDGKCSEALFNKFARRDFSDVQTKDKNHSSYTLRDEQQRAVDQTKDYFETQGKGASFLWHAKPRFGKTLSTYDLIRQMNLQNILVVTNRPSIANSWFDDFTKFISWQTDYKFVSDNDALKKKGVLSRKEFVDALGNGGDYRQIAFESLQGLKRSVYFGGNYSKLKWIKDLHWDLLVIDEAHEGVETYKTDKAFDHIDRDYTLYLTGTPFKALAEGKFSEDQIFNWSYADEQKTKANWNKKEEPSSNPYIDLPKLNMYTYQMSEIIKEKVQQKVKLDDDTAVDPAFDLNEFFKTKANGEFVHDEYVDKFLDALTHNKKYPFSTPELRDALSHTFWLLNRVSSVKALAKKLKKHPVFQNYKIIIAAGDGKFDDDELDDDQLEKENDKSLDKVRKAIAEYPKTITLSVGQLTTGVTIPEWSGVLMLSNMKSPAEYMQAAFRAQNPYTFRRGSKTLRKENAYVFDFDPARTLTIFDEFANNLSAKTANGRGTAEEHAQNIRELLNFFPVIGEDDNGEMTELDVKQIMSIPRKLKSREVVNQRFMSNFLFANTGRIFSAPAEVHDILGKMAKAKEEKNRKNDDLAHASDVLTDDDGNVKVPKDKVIGKYNDLFGDKIYSEKADEISNSVKSLDKNSNDLDQKIDKQVADIGYQFSTDITSDVVNKVEQSYSLTKSEARKYQNQIDKENKAELNKIADQAKDKHKVAQAELKEAQDKAKSQADLDKANADYDTKIDNMLSDFAEEVKKHVDNAKKQVPQNVIERIEQKQAEDKKRSVEDDARAHLRGFSRTIPSFIMAYGDRKLTLQNFDSYTEPNVFKEVTGITLEQFKFLRDGGDYKDSETGEKKHFAGHLFDEVVFNDSIQQFLDLKYKLRNYFDKSNKEDIFDYIPAQKTNQIYTPKSIVKEMVDELEENDPHVFEDPNRTFADLYMKSGLYITEIIKRLYANKEMKKLYPDNHQRLLHIINKQVYGLAPTRIIYLIATNYILGFDNSIKKDITTTHFKQADAAEYAKKGTLQELVDKIFD